MKNINIFYFDNDLGAFDEYNPRFVMEQKHTRQILAILAQKPGGFYDKNLLKRALKPSSDQEFDKAIDLLLNISTLRFEKSKIYINFPFFVAKDLKKIRKIITKELNDSLKSIEDGLGEVRKIVKEFYANIDEKVSLYHLVCGKIFDGFMFDYLEKQQILKQSFPQKDGRDYMLIGYSDQHFCNALNKRLLCSFNNARFGGDCLSSFGNASGNRLDFFRYFRLRQIGKIYGKFKKIDKNFHKIPEQEIISSSLQVIKDISLGKPVDKSGKYVNVLKSIRYLTKNGALNVPIFSNFEEIIEKIQNSIVQNMGERIISSFKSVTTQISAIDILCLTHGAPKAQLFNELWHLYFGLLNNMLVKNKIVAKPERFIREGRYLKCVYIAKGK